MSLKAALGWEDFWGSFGRNKKDCKLKIETFLTFCLRQCSTGTNLSFYTHRGVLMCINTQMYVPIYTCIYGYIFMAPCIYGAINTHNQN